MQRRFPSCAQGGDYSDRYHGAFVLDPDGNNIEAVWHAPEGSSAVAS